MRGAEIYNESLFTTVKLEDFVPANHPLRPIRTWANDALAGMDGKFSAMYQVDIKGGRPSKAPEKLMRAMLLQVLQSVRSERQFVEQISYNLLFRWFVGLAIEDAMWKHSVFSKNRDWLIEHDAVTELFNATVEMSCGNCSDLNLNGGFEQLQIINRWAPHFRSGSTNSRNSQLYSGDSRWQANR